jgi:hypothetical protein
METNNNSYSVKSQQTKGLSTFVLTLSISLIVFSAAYYLMTYKSSQSESFSDPSTANVVVKEEEQNDPITDASSKVSEDKTVFGSIADAKPNTGYRQVLSGSDAMPSGTQVDNDSTTPQTTTSANLETGITSVTVGLVLSFVLFAFTMVFVYKDPRKIALSTFEKNVSKGL